MNKTVNSKIISNVINYIEFIEKNFNLCLSIHRLFPYPDLFGKYNTHSHPYCMLIKSNKRLWDECRKQQIKVIERCTEKEKIYYGMCFCGVEEYIVPIHVDGVPTGIICATGYCTDDEKYYAKIDKLALKFNCNKEKIIEKKDFLSKNKPPEIIIERTLTIISDILSTLFRDEIIHPINTANESINYIYANIIAYIHNHYTDKITVAMVAEFCHCSESYINHVFKNINGKNISNYINHLRIQKAKELLISSDISIKEIAMMTGYDTATYFSTVFRNFENTSPKDYRISHSSV